MSREHRYFVYLMASKWHGTLYVGVTSDLAVRASQHRDEVREGFTKKYGVHMLVWFEEFANVYDAHPAREADQEMATGLEDRADRENQSGLV